MNTVNHDSLKLEDQVCFPLYAASREMIKQYKPYLDEMDLTYTQYLTMMLLWEHRSMTVKEIGEILYLDSGTLTPLLKKLETKGYLTRTRSTADERNLNIALTEVGLALREHAKQIPQRMAGNLPLSAEEEAELKRILQKILNNQEK